MNLIRTSIVESSQAHPSKDFPFANPYQHDDDNEAKYCQSYEEWHKQCLGQGLESPKISSCSFYFFFVKKFKPFLDDMELKLDCEYDYNSFTCKPIGWKDPTGYSCRLYQNSNWCNEKGINRTLTVVTKKL